MMKKVLTMFLASIMTLSAFSFVSCSSGGTTTNNGREDVGDLSGVVYDSKKGEMYVSSKDNKTRIKMSYTPGFGDAWAVQMSREFLLSESGKDYYISLDNDSELTTSVSSKLEAGMNLSDIYIPLASNWFSYASLGQLANLDDLYSMQIPGEDKIVSDKINGTWKEYGKAVSSYETHYYAFPANNNITGIVYNKTMFDKYNWQVPTTVDELKSLCAKIVSDTNGSIAPFVYPGTVTGGYWDFVGTNWWLQCSGEEKMNEFMNFDSCEVYNVTKETSPSYGKLKMLETFEDIIVKNAKQYTLKGSASKTHLLAQISFLQGQAAMIPNGNWIEKESLKEMQDEYRMMATPKMKDALKDEDGNYIEYNYSGQPDYIIIPAKAKNIEGAKKFLAFMCKDEMLKKYTSLTGTARPFIYDTSECEVTPFIKSCLEIQDKSITWFERSSSKLWTANKAKKFVTTNPYTQLLANSDTLTAIGWCQSEYTSVKKIWPTWVEAVS